MTTTYLDLIHRAPALSEAAPEVAVAAVGKLNRKALRDQYQ